MNSPHMYHLLMSISWNVSLLYQGILRLGQQYGRVELRKDSMMSPLLLIVLALALFVCAFGYMTYHHEAERRAKAARETKRNEYLDRL